MERRLRVHETILEQLFRACGAKGGGGLPAALAILRDANGRGLLSGQQKVRAATRTEEAKLRPRLKEP